MAARESDNTINKNSAQAETLVDSIIELGTSMGLAEKWLERIVNYAVSEFSKKGLGSDYYAYHNIDHELEATYFTLLAAKGQSKANKFSDDDIKYLFVAALFHDFDPDKQFDKPNEDSVELFIRNDKKIKEFVDELGINLDLVIALIHRTAYPWRVLLTQTEIAEHALKRIDELFVSAGIPENDDQTRKHYMDLGWFLSVAERIAGYALGNFEKSKELAGRNAHGLSWHPAVINEQSVNYFSVFKEEREMVDRVLQGVPREYGKRFLDNAEAFKEAWKEELGIKRSIQRNEVRLVSCVEEIKSEFDPEAKEAILQLYKELPAHIRVDKEKFVESLSSKDTILITLRINEPSGKIVGYAKGGPLENYQLRQDTHDENIGKRNTAYLESISVRYGYWGETGGHLLRLQFLSCAKQRGYKYVSSYVHRNVIKSRKHDGESIKTVKEYDPDQRDYYRQDLSTLKEFLPATMAANVSDTNRVDKGQGNTALSGTEMEDHSISGAG